MVKNNTLYGLSPIESLMVFNLTQFSLDFLSSQEETLHL